MKCPSNAKRKVPEHSTELCRHLPVKACDHCVCKKFPKSAEISSLTQSRRRWGQCPLSPHPVHIASETLENFTTLTSRMVWCQVIHTIPNYHCGKIIYWDVNVLNCKNKSVFCALECELFLSLRRQPGFCYFFSSKCFQSRKSKFLKDNISLAFVKASNHGEDDVGHSGGGWEDDE